MRDIPTLVTRVTPPQNIVDIDWGDITQAVPAFLTIATMPLVSGGWKPWSFQSCPLLSALHSSCLAVSRSG